ncbi:ABC transporter permease [Campylobacter sp. CCS1377]|uniref:ABC transporter permease n=1 Tax=Campylobacter sp. CCS1377 TaxID=3158229 RepID=A0AAU7E9A1_9BACT|nr:ABC transporter permease [Campylobacter jejuni]
MLKNYIYLGIFLSCVVFAICIPLSPHEVDVVDLSNAKISPSWEYFFGSDLLGRDVFTRIGYSFRISLFVGLGASFLALCFAIFYVGLMRIAFREFWLRILDMFLAMPSLLFIMFFQSILAGNIFVMIFVIALGHWAFMAKLLDSKLCYFEKSDFYLAALVLGSSKFRAFFFELLPACFHIFFLLFLLNITHAIAAEATLSFFGLGLDLSEASLGTMLNDASKGIFSGAWWIVVFPIIALLALVLPLLALADNLRKNLGVKI